MCMWCVCVFIFECYNWNFLQLFIMSTLDDKLLGEKTHYYCSSSEDEHEDDDDDIPKNSSSTNNRTDECGNRDTDVLVGSKIRSDFSKKWDNSVNVSQYINQCNS